jgi:hypothetical protein
MIQEFGTKYLNRCPSVAEIERVMTIDARQGFPGMVALQDFKHFSWKNCPLSLAAQYKGKKSDKTFVLEMPICTFGIISLARQVHSMISTFSTKV